MFNNIYVYVMQITQENAPTLSPGD